MSTKNSWSKIKSWTNPSPEYAQESYSNAKTKYSNAASAYVQNNKQMESYQTEYKSCSAKVDSMRSDKISFERRIEAIGEVIRMLDDGGTVDQTINDANHMAQQTEEAFHKNFYCTGIAKPPIAQAFSHQTVSQNTSSASALSELKKEKSRLEQSLQELGSKLNAMEQNVEALTSKMNALASTQSDLAKTMKNTSFEMNHFKKYC